MGPRADRGKHMGITAISGVATAFRDNLAAGTKLDRYATRLLEEVGKPTVDWANAGQLAEDVRNVTSEIGVLPGVKDNAIRRAVDALHSLRQPAGEIEAASNQLAYNEMRAVRLWSVDKPVNPVSVYRDARLLAENAHAGVNDLLKALGVAPR